MLRLWYDSPACEWTEALPLGSGRLGAMAHGGIAEERIDLNEDTLWSGYPCDHNIKGASAHVARARELTLRGGYAEAQELIERETLGRYSESYMPAGSLLIGFKDVADGDAASYSRELDLERAVSRVSFTAGGAAHTRECFASAPDGVFVMRLTCGMSGGLSFSCRMASSLRHTVSAVEHGLWLEGLAPSHVEPNYKSAENPVVYEDDDGRKGMRYAAALRVAAEGGSARASGGEWVVEGADAATLIVCVRTSFNGPDRHPYTGGKPYAELVREDIARASALPYEELLERHIADHAALFSRVSLSLGDDRFDRLTTLERLKRLDPDDRGLFVLLFQYGRYLLIASSRPGAQAANLQGIWNNLERPPWSSNYTININTQMNYWPAESCALPETHEPLFDLIEDLSSTGAAVARDYYGARGFTAHHNTDLWRVARPVGERRKGGAAFGFWPVGAGWLCRHLMEHYEYTLDEEFLRARGYPLMKEAARFFLDTLCEDGKGGLIHAPATSPENRFLIDGEPRAVARSAAMTQSVIVELFGNVVRAAGILNIDNGFARELQGALARITPFEAGSDGRLKEWSEELPEAEPSHRHISHLYAHHPARLITARETPALADAVRRSLEARGDDATGWSLGWKVNQWARLLDGDRALKLLRMQLRLVDTSETHTKGGGTYPNLFDAHPPFQIDGNFGATAGIAEMLLQSYDGKLLLLPALPSAWPEGEVTGLRAKGALTVDMRWTNGELVSTRIHALRDAAFTLVYGDEITNLHLAPGETRAFTP